MSGTPFVFLQRLSVAVIFGYLLAASVACSDSPASPQTDAPIALDGSADSVPTPDAANVADSHVDTVLDAGVDLLADAGSDLPIAPPWPEWAFHHWIWEDESTQLSATQIIDDYLAHDIPVGALIIDSPWETGYNTLQWDPTRFPDPQKMIDDLHGKNVRVMLWIVPAINVDVQPLYELAKNNNYFMKLNPFGGPEKIDWWKGTGSMIDYFNPAAVAWWHQMVDSVLAYEIDGWKCDGLDISIWKAPWSPGSNAIIPRATYSDAYYRDFFDYTRQKLGNDRIITARPVDTYGYDPGPLINEAAFSPRDIAWASWVGDQDATFNGMKAALLNMYYSSQLGYVAFGSDIGGYRTENIPNGRTKELFVRWAQLGAFCPVMENGGGGEHRPWMFDTPPSTETTDIYRTFVKLHYAMIPYLMQHGARAFAQQKSLMTFIDKVDYSYLLGPDIFVAPMIASGQSRRVTFPAGDDWIYLFDKTKVFSGGNTTTLTVPLTEFPVFLKKGSSIASTLQVVP